MGRLVWSVGAVGKMNRKAVFWGIGGQRGRLGEWTKARGS